MKNLITLLLALLTGISVAQYNNTYDINANSDVLNPAFVITNKKAESITVSYASDGFFPVNNYFILTKHDAFGTVLYNNRIDAPNAPKEGFTNVEALIQTDDDGVLVAGYYYDDYTNIIEQPFLLKVDVNGNFQWLRIYTVNQKPINNSQLNKISLCRVYDDPKENYFIVGSGDSDANPGVDVATNVIKVDASGSMIFSKKYYDTNPMFAETREYPGDVEFSFADDLYMITGYREDFVSFTSRSMMYFFGIDNSGNVVTKFLTLQSKSIPLDQDMIYDPNQKLFATVFMHEKNGYVTSAASIIGFIEIDGGLNISNPKYLWHNEGDYHDGRSISLCKSGDYVLGSWIHDPNIQLRNPAWLKVDNTGIPISNLLRYNIKDDVVFGHHCTSFNPITGDEEYILVNEQKTDLRMIRTDVNGDACGVDKYTPYVDKYTPVEETYQYYDKESGTENKYKVQEKLFSPNYRKCSAPGTSYRTMAVTHVGIADGEVLLYPSVISKSEAKFTIENNSAAFMNIEVRNITGQVIGSSAQIGSGKTEIKLSSSSLSAGIYLVSMYDTKGKLSATAKILVTE